MSDETTAGVLVNEGTPEIGRTARISSGIFRREIVHAPTPTESVVLFVPGVTGDSERYDGFVEDLNEAGLDVLRFGGWHAIEDLAELSLHDLLVAIEDTVAILRRRGYGFVGYVGKSFGGALGILGRGTGIDRMVVWAPALGFGTSNAGTMVSEELSGIERLTDVRLGVQDLKEKTWPILVVNGSEDPILPPATAKAIADALPNAERIEVAAGHSVDKNEDTAELTIAYLTG